MWDLLTPEERQWKQTCRTFAAEVIEPEFRRYDRDNCFPRTIVDSAHDAGLMNVGFARALGGRGLSHRSMVVGGEELAAVCSPTAFAMGFNHGALQPILHAGTDDQKQRLVRDLIFRRGNAAICLTEAATSGSNLMGLHCRATRNGSGWLLSGSKVMVGNGCDADLFVVLADAVGHGLTFFAVPRGPRVQVGPNTDKLGFRCVTTPTVSFEEVEVPDDDRIGEIGGAEKILLRTLDYIRFGGSAVILGIVVGALREALPWLSDRRVGLGEPLITKSHVQLELAEIYTGIRSVRHLMWRAADLLDQGARCSLETSMAKLSASRLAVAATNTLLQMYGWRGIDNQYGIHKRLRDARVTTIYEGTSELQLLNIFRELSQAPDSGEL